VVTARLPAQEATEELEASVLMVAVVVEEEASLELVLPFLSRPVEPEEPVPMCRAPLVRLVLATTVEMVVMVATTLVLVEPPSWQEVVVEVETSLVAREDQPTVCWHSSVVVELI